MSDDLTTVAREIAEPREMSVSLGQACQTVGAPSGISYDASLQPDGYQIQV
jgi:hypothetical protein